MTARHGPDVAHGPDFVHHCSVERLELYHDKFDLLISMIYVNGKRAECYYYFG